MLKLRFTPSKILYGILFTLIVFSTALSSYVSFFSFFDEALFAVAVLYIIVRFLVYHEPIQKEYALIALSTILLLFFGLMGNAAWDYQESNVAIAKDVLALIKFPVMIIAMAIWNRHNSTDAALDVAYFLSKIFITVFCAFAVLSLFVDFGRMEEIRNGIHPFRFIFSHPTFLVYSTVVMSVVMVAHGIKLWDLIFHAESMVVLIMTMRDKAFAYIVIYVVLLVILPRMKKIRLWHILLAFAGAFAISYQKIQTYIGYSWSPRAALLSSGLDLMKKCFPIGSGFGTFASSISGEYYSSLYYTYGFYGKEGVTEMEYSALADTQWPYYYAQFGFFGLLAFLLILVLLYRLILKSYLFSDSKRKAVYLMLGYMVMASVVENVFTNESGVTAVVVIFLFVGKSMLGAPREKQEPGSSKKRWKLVWKGSGR